VRHKKQLRDIEKLLSGENSLEFQALITHIERRHQCRITLLEVAGDFNAKCQARLTQLKALLATPSKRSVDTEPQPVLSHPITEEQLQMLYKWQLRKATECESSSQPSYQSIRLNNLLTEVSALADESRSEMIQLQKCVNAPEPILRSANTLLSLQRSYKRAYKELHYTKRLLDKADKDSALELQKKLEQNKTIFINAQANFVDALRDIRSNFGLGFDELKHSMKEAPESFWLSMHDFKIEDRDDVMFDFIEDFDALKDKIQNPFDESFVQASTHFQNQIKESIFLATHNSKTYALKRRANAVATREFHVLRKLQHPFLTRVEAIFADSHSTAVLVLPWIDGQTMNNWLLLSRPSVDQVRNIFYSVLQALSYVHAANVVHGDLQLSNILIDGLDHPYLCDFDQSVDPTFFPIDDLQPNQPALDAKSREYCAPELLENNLTLKTRASDMFAFGACIWQALIRDRKWFIPDTEKFPEVPATTIPGLRGAIEGLMRREPERRPSAVNALNLPFFTATSLTTDNATILSAKTRVEAFQASIKRLKQINLFLNDNSLPQIFIRSRALNDVAEGIWDFVGLCAHKHLHIEDNNVLNRDTITSEIFAQFLESVCASELFEWGSSGKCLPSAIPFSLNNEVLYKAVGVVLARALIEEYTLAAPFASALYKYLLADAEVHCKVTDNDLEDFDPQLSRNMTQLLSPQGDCTLYGFEDLNQPRRDVTEENKQLYYKSRLRWTLIDSRNWALSLIGEGFYSIRNDFNRHVGILDWQDLQQLLSGHQNMESQQLLTRLQFQGFAAESETPKYLRNVIQKMGSEELSRFIYYITSQETLPITSASRPITVKLRPGDDRTCPVASSCYWTLSIPEYSSEEALCSRLQEAMEYEAKLNPSRL